MSKTVTRDFVSQNFIFTDRRTDYNKQFDKNAFVEKINFWKYVLKYKCNAVPQESILIGLQVIGLDYFSIIIAAAELSLKIVVVDYNRTDKFTDIEYKDPKTKLLSPIDIFLHDFLEDTIETDRMYAKFLFFKKHSTRTYSTLNIDDIVIDDEKFKSVIDIKPDPAHILFKVTSSGTSDVPKIIEHSHEFIFEVATRNSKFYKGIALHVSNLNHGASASVTLLPVLNSEHITEHLFYDGGDIESMEGLVEEMSSYKDSIGFLSFPYPFLIDKFIEVSRNKNVKWPKLDLITLSYILDSAKHAVRDSIFNSITSIFGSNETLGPLFINRADTENWNIDSRCFKTIDDFYKIVITSEGKITVTVPVYDKAVETNDYFRRDGDVFIHQGRSDMLRINGETINLNTINTLNKKNTDTYIVADTLNHCLYLACWKNLSTEQIQTIKEDVEKNFNRVKITKISTIDKSNFYYGIKIDNELLREYFRSYNV